MGKRNFYVVTVVCVIFTGIFTILEPMAKDYSSTSFQMGPYISIMTLAWPIIFGLIGYCVMYGLDLFYYKRQEKVKKYLWIRVIITLLLCVYVILYVPYWAAIMGNMLGKGSTYQSFFENQTIWNSLTLKFILFMQNKTFLFLFVGGAMRLS